MKEHPDWVIYGSETASCVSSRGVYHLPIQKYEKQPSLQISSYDIIAPPWAYCPDVEFAYQDKLPQVLGEFVWTGFDYIGEPTPYFRRRAAARPIGRRAALISAWWIWRDSPRIATTFIRANGPTKPMVHVLPHWNWAGQEGQAIPVMAYTNADEVELFLNGKSLGRKKRFGEPVEIPVGQNVSHDQKVSEQVPAGVAGSLRAGQFEGGGLSERQAGGGG